MQIPQAFLFEARVHPRFEQDRVEGFIQVIIRAHLDTARDRGDVFARAGHDHGNIVLSAIGCEMRHHLIAVEFRHIDIEQQKIESIPRQEFKDHPAVLGHGDFMSEDLETAREQQSIDFVVIGYQQTGTTLRHAHGS